MNHICSDGDSFVKQKRKSITKAGVRDDSLFPEGVTKQQYDLQEELSKKADDRQDYDAVADEGFRLNGQKEKSRMDTETWEEKLKRVKE